MQVCGGRALQVEDIAHAKALRLTEQIWGKATSQCGYHMGCGEDVGAAGKGPGGRGPCEERTLTLTLHELGNRWRVWGEDDVMDVVSKWPPLAAERRGDETEGQRPISHASQGRQIRFQELCQSHMLS